MTEEEAKTKLCCGPHILHPGNGDAKCVASFCMAWRQIPERVETKDMDYGQFPQGETGWQNLGTSYDWQGLRYERRTPGGGFCGLAGAPQ